MADKYITEILPDLDKMPDWARKAFEAGQFFDVAFKRVQELERAMDDIENIIVDIDPTNLNIKDIMAIGSTITIYNMKKGTTRKPEIMPCYRQWVLDADGNSSCTDKEYINDPLCPVCAAKIGDR